VYLDDVGRADSLTGFVHRDSALDELHDRYVEVPSRQSYDRGITAPVVADADLR
jgi:hypothetical protein